eukprot:scaffold33395_cov58-Attheya_sp.AAC.1
MEKWVSYLKYSRAWNASLYLTPADKMCDNQNNRCKSQHVTVLNECLHVLGSRLCYQKKEGSVAYLAKEVRRLGCLYKEIRLDVNDVNRDSHCVGSVMVVYKRHLAHMGGDAIMIKSLATSSVFEGHGLASSFFQDLCKLHHDYTIVFAMVMDKDGIHPVKSGKQQSSENIIRGPPKELYKKYGFVEDSSSSTTHFDVDKEFVETGCFLMYTNIQRLRNQSYSVLQLNARTLDIDPTVIHEMRWNPTQNRFEGLNIHYPKDVVVIDPRQCSGISPKDFQDRRKVKENHMKYRKLHPGNRLTSVTSPMISSTETSFPDIPLLFRGRSNESGECLWASATLLIHSMDKFAGISMMHYYNNNPDCFEWLSMYTGRGIKRNPNLPVESDCKTECGLSSLLTINTDFNLHKIRGQDGAIGNLEYVKQVGSGYFVCNLKDQMDW